LNSIEEVIGSTDIYLVDQIMKGRYKSNEIILDAGCGSGRNLHWFLRNNIVIYGIDQEANVIHDLRRRHPAVAERWSQSAVEKMPFENSTTLSAVRYYILPGIPHIFKT
jgi:ubiquinone/menaquinone biosynthesis C-methylase UbiE